MNKPQIRFKGFTDPWEQRKLDELISKGGSGGTPSTTNTDFYKGDIPFLSITDITNSNGYIYDTEKHITQEAMNSSAAWLVPSESISLAMYASVGKVAILKANCATSQAFYNMIFYRDETKNFVYQYLKNMEETNSWNSLISTGTQANLNAEKVKNLTISIPENKDEQKIISDYFNRLDDLITLHQRKFIENVFILHIAWEQRKVSDMFKVTRGYVLPVTKTDSKKTIENPYPVYSSQTLNNGLMGYYSEYLYKDAITWTTDGANAGTVRFRPDKFYCTNVCGVLLSNNNPANKMIAEALNNVAWKHVSYVGNPKLMNNVMSDIEIKIPTKIDEQNRISELFDQLDNLITLHQRE